MLKARICLSAVAITFLIILGGCTTGVDPSPHPGILRVVLTSKQTDTMLVISSDTTKFSRWDEFWARVYGGRVYQGDNYASLYATTSMDRITSVSQNMLAREWLDGTPITIRDTATITPQNSRYREGTVFEFYAPPGTYDRLDFALTATEVATYIPKIYINPVVLPPGVPAVMSFPGSYTLQEDRTTVVEVEIAPFESLLRFQDSFLFNRKMQIISVTML
ncbi:MAG: hypothetical protein H6Q30_998 [Bacteroidetes bacterium]|nr:hypothetical protein [Bacteroidota bacterium]